jgi:hypothetical protein
LAVGYQKAFKLFAQPDRRSIHHKHIRFDIVRTMVYTTVSVS